MHNNKLAQKIFISVMAILIIFWISGLLVDNTGNQVNVFFRKAGNYFADYFNVAKYSATKNPYWFGLKDPLPTEHAYLPITYLLFYGLSLLAPYKGYNAFIAGNTSFGILTSHFFMTICIVLLYEVIRRLLKIESKNKSVIAIILMFSSVVLFSFERGNIIILTAALCGVFILGYKSDHKVISELALVALAFAAGFKAYPAILGILLIYDKQWLKALRLMIYGVLVAFIPFLYMKGGFANIDLWLSNVSKCNAAYQFGGFPRFNFRYIAAFVQSSSLKEIMYLVLPKITLLLSIVMLSGLPLLKQEWKKIAALISIIVIYPVNSAQYTGLYYLLVIAMFLTHLEWCKLDWLYLFLLILIINPFQLIIPNFIQKFWIGDTINMTTLLMNIAASTIFLIISIESIFAIIKFIRDP